MKPRNLLLGLLLCASVASAADVITCTDGTKIDAKVEEITKSVIRYRKASNLTGPVYSVPVASVAKIAYDNGETDIFNVPVNTATQPATTPLSPTDEELLRKADELTLTDPALGTISDAELLKRYYTEIAPAHSKIMKYRKIGWIGGSILAVGGIAAGLGIMNYVGTEDTNLYCPFLIGGPVAGVAWCLGFNIRANQVKRQAQEMQIYSSSLIENEILRFGQNSLIAGVSMMGNHVTHTRGYGLSLKFNF